ncbi:hypothetical protein ONS96_012728 [Cadophora gregata f. sp. sojae]|nr:hypothetical protein ONS96_012728 [Cadophora gregata f. sp. sojae]
MVPCPSHIDSSKSASALLLYADVPLPSIAGMVKINSYNSDMDFVTCPDCAGGRTSGTCATCGGTGVIIKTASYLSGHPSVSGTAMIASAVDYEYL